MLLDDHTCAPTQPVLAQVWRPVFTLVPVLGRGSLEVQVRAEPVGKPGTSEASKRPNRGG